MASPSRVRLPQPTIKVEQEAKASLSRARKRIRYVIERVTGSFHSRKAETVMGDRYNIHSQLEHLQSKYIGTGHADTGRFEWLVNQHRDSYASYMGHYDMLNFFSIAENETKARIRFNLMEKMLQPCGPPPEKPED